MLQRAGVSEVLRRRAGVLARRPPAAEPDTPVISLLEFQVAGERYGLDVRYVQEVCRWRQFTRLPGTPAFLAGIMNLRGRVLSVVDLRRLLELPDPGLPAANKVIVLRHAAMTLGVLAREILGMRAVPLRSLHPPLPPLDGKRLEYLQGITPEWTAVLDAEKLLEDQRLVVNDP
jgi:purine-binding chemotaxis protein CheW